MTVFLVIAGIVLFYITGMIFSTAIYCYIEGFWDSYIDDDTKMMMAIFWPIGLTLVLCGLFYTSVLTKFFEYFYNLGKKHRK